MRDISASIQAAVDANWINIFLAVKLELDGADINLWTGVGDLVYFGTTYTGVGTLLGISQIEETAELSARGATLSLSGIPSTLMSLALTEQYQGRKATIYFGVLGSSASTTGGWAILTGLWDDTGIWVDSEIWSDTPLSIMQVFNGYLDQMNINESSSTCVISVTIESKLIDLERPRTFRFNSASQKAMYPGDLGMDFVEDLQDKQFTWGRS